MPRWLKSRLGASVAAGTLAIGVVGGLAFAVAGPLMGSSVSSTTPATQAAAGGQAAAGAGVACARAGAAAGSSAASGAAAGSARCAGRAGILRRILARTEHASFTLRGKGGTWVTITLDRGTIQSISPTSITIVRPDGVSVTAPITSSTKFRRAAESSLAAGDRVVLVQQGGSARAVVALGQAGAGAGAGAANPTT